MIDGLCEKYRVPYIGVMATKIHDDFEAQFDIGKCVIVVNSNVSKQTLAHEFYHYLTYLISIAERLDETLAEEYGNTYK